MTVTNQASEPLYLSVCCITKFRSEITLTQNGSLADALRRKQESLQLSLDVRGNLSVKFFLKTFRSIT